MKSRISQICCHLLTRRLVATAVSIHCQEIARMRPVAPAAAVARRDVPASHAIDAAGSDGKSIQPVPDLGPAATRTDCVSAIVPEGLPARTKREVMEKSKADKQYGMGIQETGMEKPRNLVDSAKYWETRCM